MSERETVPFDVLIVGGGPAGLSAAIRVAQLAAEAGKELEIGVVEKASQCGLHCMSGAVMDTRALKELLPDYADNGFPGGAVVEWDSFHYMMANTHIKVPGFLVPPVNNNHGKVTLSLQKFAAWLAEQAEELGVMILTDTCATELIRDDDGAVLGVRTGDKGLGHDGQPLANHEPGYDLTATVTILSEGPYGTLAEDLMHAEDMKKDAAPQIYSLGVKELIKNDCKEIGIDPDVGFSIHTLGFPMPKGAFGGGWLYHLGKGQFSVGYVLGLSWGNPALDLQAVFNEYKKHPLLQKYLRGGEVLAYGAKTIPEGGYFAIPKLHHAGCLIVGDSAGLVNVRTLKGIHYAMKSGMLAAETAFEAVGSEDASEAKLAAYREALDASWIMEDLYRDRNFRHCFHGNLHVGLAKTMLNDFTGGGSKSAPSYPMDWKEWGKTSDFSLRSQGKDAHDPNVILDKMTDVHLSGTEHREDQPSHIKILEPEHCQDTCIPKHGGTAPCTHFCPAQVYELKEPAEPSSPIQVNFSNCVHCRTCVIVDPCDVEGSDHFQNIEWRAPNEGGPKYLGL
ncbi:MAG: electron-transfer flavoprotein:ubiquinone oxidoreductase [Acidobacteriota bacterium]